ncbi:Pheromone/general odorant binding protein [Cinara cedri]|uniref:Pheromone/general odorant binding protein n=1 Tax=Cinara cedri TaxID=506608 RepID=A0A5E4MAW1_9HEMI|nr:Pheromone/general odorant binding protein [Cinara cedri]
MNPSKYHVTLLLVVSLCCLVTGRFTTEQIDQYGKACNASEEDLAVAKQYKVPTSESGKCLMKCMISKLGLLNDDGTYNKQGTEEALKKYWSEWPVNKIEQINDKCYEEAKKVSSTVVSTCIYSYHVMACINTQAKILGVL